MRIVDAKWTPLVNYLVLECCTKFLHRADQVHIMCPICKGWENLHLLREKELNETK